MGIPQKHLVWKTIIRKNLEWLLPKILFIIKVKILFTGKNSTINLKKLNLEILLLGNTNQILKI